MNIDALKELLNDFKNGRLSEDAVLEHLRTLPFEDLGFAKVDHHRSLRRGFPEVVYGAGKTVDQIVAIAESMVGKKTNLLVTRCDIAAGEALLRRFPEGTWHAEARAFTFEMRALSRAGYVLVITAGTTDIPVAEEAAVTADLLGCNVDRIYDVGVAGIHRLMAYQSMIEAADAVVVVAGMEGALASVVGAMSRAPVVAVPTSIGYGASFGGLAALLSMMTSCAAGVTVVNIDNGFGAGCAAAIIVAKARELAARIDKETAR
ncbi:MAG TPA: nickel pincer cofactor biosynthesis protein LarB [Candidatus Krumholzibacteria bacterium]|nr:nickel pincer cofactor biosynthesis protein LarB [Candidatus Krumholzibacteria bacterium]